MNLDPLPQIATLLRKWDFSHFWADLSSRIIVVALVVFLAWFVWWITVKVVYRILKKIVNRTKVLWDDELLERNFFNRLAWIAPAVIVRVTGPAYLDGNFNLMEFFVKLSDVVITASIALALVDLLSFVNSLYDRKMDFKKRPIKGIVQAVQVIILTAGLIVVFSVLTERPVSGLLTGLGALSAVLLIVFQEPLKGLVAGFQLSSNDMVRIGDWIEMPSQGADGDVIDISLLNVTVRNWDKTYVTFPIQSLTSGSFKNWRGMSESGGRRIKRSVGIDMSSIRFLNDEEIESLGSIILLKDYLKEKSNEIREWNEKRGEDRSASPVNGRALTNIGIFRAYAKAYVSNHPQANPKMTLLVRQRQSGPEGLPIEIYVFSSDKVWANYEDIQSDIFDHLFAVLPEFGLKAFQKPSGNDILALSRRSEDGA